MFSEIRERHWVLRCNDGELALTNTEYNDTHGNPYYIAGGKPPHKPTSPGIIWVYRDGAPLAQTYAVYPQSLGMSWSVENVGAGVERYAGTNIVQLAHKT